MKWIGQHIWDLISRFRYYVYIEKADPSTSTRALVIDEEGKVGTNSTIGTGGVDSVTTTDGTYIDMTPNVATTGAVTVASDLSAVDGTSVAATRFLSKDNTWDVPSYSPLGTVTSITTTIDGNCLTISTAASQTITTSGTFDLEFVGSSAQYISGEGNLITFPTIPAVGVASFTNANGTYISAATVNTAATGIVTTGIIDLSAVDGTSDSATRFLSKDNTWDVPSYTVLPAAGVTSFTNANGTFVSNSTTNTLSTGIVTLGRVDLSATGTPNATNFLCGDNTWKVPPYATGTVTNVSSTNTNILTVANPTTTPALTPVMGTVSAGSTGIVTGGQVDTAIDARYTYSYFAYSFRCSTTTDEEWYFPSDNGITKYEWNNRDAGSAVPGSIALTDTLTIDRYSFQSGIFIPQTCIFAGFYGTVRMANNLPNTAHPVIAIFHNAPIANGSTSNITPGCIAFDTTNGAGNRLNRMNVLESNQEAALAAGSVIFPAFGPDVALTSTGVAIGQITLKFKTLIP